MNELITFSVLSGIFAVFLFQAYTILNVIYLLASAIMRGGPNVRKREDLCPTCGQNELRVVTFLRLTIIIDGRQAPDSCTFLRCKHCHAKFSRRSGGDLIPVSEEEWHATFQGRDWACMERPRSHP